MYVNFFLISISIFRSTERATNMMISEQQYVALKVVKSAQHYTETATDEIQILKKIHGHSTCKSSIDELPGISDDDETPPSTDMDYDDRRLLRKRWYIVRLLNHFKVSGVNGVHTCLVFEALGVSLYRLIVRNHYHGLPLPLVKHIIKQVLHGLDYLHQRSHIIHTDIKPENILLVNSADLAKVMPSKRYQNMMNNRSTGEYIELLYLLTIRGLIKCNWFFGLCFCVFSPKFISNGYEINGWQRL